jgi:Asp-tRNA(Asn)/Glu-tRNA(Gln) amidotransferase A subunit family amidase
MHYKQITDNKRSSTSVPKSCFVICTYLQCNLICVSIKVCCYRSGTVDSIHGPSKNIWQSGKKYALIKNAEKSAASIEDVQGCSSVHGFKVGCRELHQLSSPSSKGSSPVEEDDWFITGGSSGGSAVAVASGTVFA